MEKLNKLKFRLNKLFYFIFYERFNKKINFNFDINLSRIDLIKKIIIKKNFTSYLEIGCDNDRVFSKIRVPFKIGVDPVSGGNYRDTSDNFFKINKKTFDIIFIDGLHEYDQVLRDITNSIKFLNNGGIILIHDTLPSSVHQQATLRYKKIWNGDVWKSIVNLRNRKDIDVVTCRIDHGVSLVQKKSNENFLNLKLSNFKKQLSFRDFYYNYKTYMRLMDYKEVLSYLKI